METLKKDIAIIGGGPGGYVAAIRAAQLGRSVVLFERDRVGGTCMNWGCIPTKHLLHQTKVFQEVRRSKTLTGPLAQIGCNWIKVQEEKRKVVDRLVRGVEFLLQHGGIEVVAGEAILADERTVLARTGEGEKKYEAGSIILASGSRAANLPFLAADGTDVVTSTEALAFEAPPKSLLVVGAGAIGLEMGTIYARLGTEVTVLEILPQILPGSDRELAGRLELLLKRQGVKVLTQMRIESHRRADGRSILAGTCLKNQTPFEFQAERVLLAAGRKPNSESLFTGAPFLPLSRQGYLETDETLRTIVPGVFAIGDLIGGKLLAHKASHEGLAAAANAAGGRETVRYDALPMAVFTDPEFASVGLTEEEARSRTDHVRIGVFSFQANGRALTMDCAEGQVKIVAGPDDRILGAHILGPCASDLLAELTLAMTRGLTAAEVAGSIHIHPTLSEAVMEAALKVGGVAIHAVN
ncbi:MAG: dihydrolipoyl dehydrogenase [Candidatus Aminicenantes bacterium]|nr:dihydrolipoyl dehydrogenase [Candidatus Aminicenantes bacterium]